MSGNRYPRPRGGSQNHRMPHQINYHMMNSMSQARPLIPHGQVPQQQYPVPAATQLFMSQQHTGLSYAGAAGFNPATFPQYQPTPQQLRQFQPPTTHHPYPQQQPTPIMQINPAAAAGGMAAIMDTSQLLQGTTPPNISYMSHHPPIQQPSSTVSQQIPAAKASKAIKIVNPNTMKEVDTTNLSVKSSPVSSARSTPKPESEQVQQQFKQNVHGIVTTTSDDVTTTQPSPPIATVTPLVSGSDVTTTVVADSTTNLTNTISMDEKPKPTITPTVSDASQPLTSESVHQKEFTSDVTKDTSSEVIAKEESEVVPEESTNESDTLKSSEVKVEQLEQLPPEASNESSLPEQQNVVVNSSSSVSHEDSKAEETEEVSKPDTDMVIKEADDKLEEQKSIVYKNDGEEINMLEQQRAAESTKSVVEDDVVVAVAPPTLDRPPIFEDKQHVDEEASTTLTDPLQMETGGDVPEEINKDLPSTEEKKDNDVGEQLVTVELESDGDKEKNVTGGDDDKDKEKATVEDQPAPLSEVDEGCSDFVAADSTTMINGEGREEGQITDDDEEDDNKHYSRDFLLSLQFVDQCKQRPVNLQNAEYIRKEQMKQSEMRFDGPPGYYTSGGDYNRRRGPHIPSKRRIDLPTKEPVELRKADKRWVRSQEVDGTVDESVKETQELFRKFVSILNKLTPQKFETLANQALQLPVDTEERLKGCIDRIFSKALEEPNFSVAYAQLCRVLSKVSVEVGSGPEAKKKTFRSLLLTKCQQEFEKDKESDDALNELRKKVEESATPEEKKRKEEELDETEYRVRHKYLGNIKFIGELFKIKMLSEGIMHECIRRLLQHTGDEEALECFAKLMFTIGKDLDHEKGHGLIQQYMDRVDMIIKAGKTSSRIKFFLQDVVELRNCNWVPRRENNNPKKIDQIHEEAKQEEAEKQRQLAVHAAGPPVGGRQMSKGSMDFGRKGSKDTGGKMGGDWQVGGDKDKKSATTQQPPKLDSTKFRNIGKGGPFSLAPSNKLSMRPGGGGGANGEKTSRQESTKKPSRSSGSKRDSQRSINTGSAATSGQMGGARRSHSGPDKYRERQSALELASNISRPGSSSSSKGAESKTVSVLKRPAPDALSEEEVEKQASSLIAEFCQNVDYQAAVEEVKDLKSPGKHHRLVCQVINDVLEKSNKARTDTGKLFHKLVKEEVVEREKFVAGFTEVLEFAEDIEIDVPKIWQYLGEIVVPVIEDGTISLDILTKAPSSVIESGKAALLLAEVLKLSEKIMGCSHVSTMWTKSSVSYSNFRISDVEEFKKKHGLQFLPDVTTSLVADVKRLTELFKSRDNTNTEIMQYIEKEHPESKECSLVFIRDLLGTSMFHAVIDGSGSSARYNEELFDSRMELVTKYVQPQNDSQHQRQVEFLCAMQMVLHDLEQPAGLATAVCKKLSETGIFEDAAFFRWRDSAAGIVGHGATMMALKEFYEWLDSTPVESDYSQ